MSSAIALIQRKRRVMKRSKGGTFIAPAFAKDTRAAPWVLQALVAPA